jgi:hypothetical protein
MGQEERYQIAQFQCRIERMEEQEIAKIAENAKSEN